MGPLGQAIGSISSLQHALHDREEVDENYRSYDDNDDCPLLMRMMII